MTYKTILTAQEELILKAADEIFYLDWRENDDDQNTAGWRHSSYFTEINGAVDFSRLVECGLMERRDGTLLTDSYRISESGRAYVATGRRGAVS